MPEARLAFVDVETTGLSPGVHRVIEIGVVTADGDRVSEWSTLINPGVRVSGQSRFFGGIDSDVIAGAPRFKDIAPELFGRLEGRLFIAHNARFDHAFLKAEFKRAGIEFYPRVVCSVMLSRKLYSMFARHDLDSLMERHALTAAVRHRALPDAQLIRQFWEVLHREHPHEAVETAIEGLLAGPVLPEHLDPALIDRLPETSGVYVLHGADNLVLHVGKAGNLKLHVQNYFRLDRTSAKALAISHRITNITWRVTRGALGAQLQHAALSKALLPARRAHAAKGVCSWRIVPERSPGIELISLADCAAVRTGPSFGIFNSELKARNALQRIAIDHGLCYSLLGIPDSDDKPCVACAVNADRGVCTRPKNRLRHLTRAIAALEPIQLPAWPYAGPIGVRERADLHIIDDWRYLGTANCENDVYAVLQTRPPDFDQEVFALLAKRLPKLSRKQILQLQGHARTSNV
jgi:DNA polymerase-3 subunit epsilon